MADFTREQIHREIARHVRNHTVVRFAPPEHPAGPAHFRDGDAWVLKLSLAEADIATSAVIDALERLGLIPVQEPSRFDLTRQVEQALTAAGHAEEGTADFGWRRHRPIDSGAHLLVTCVPDAMWQAMPGAAVRTAISQHLHRYAIALTAAGLGVAEWGRNGQIEALIVADNPASADQQAPDIGAYLAARNPEARQAGEDGESHG